MSIFCGHKWKTLSTTTSNTFDPEFSETLPIRIDRIIEQQCEKCGKQIIRKYKI